MEVLSRIFPKRLYLLFFWVSQVQLIFPITDGEVKAQKSRPRVVSHMDVALCTFWSKLAALGWLQGAETQGNRQLATESRLDPVSHPELLLLLQPPCRAQLGEAEKGGHPSAWGQALSPVSYFISPHNLSRNNVIASPPGNTAFLCHGNVYPTQMGEFWLWGRGETCSKKRLVKRRSVFGKSTGFGGWDAQLHSLLCHEVQCGPLLLPL